MSRYFYIRKEVRVLTCGEVREEEGGREEGREEGGIGERGRVMKGAVSR